MFIIQQSNDTDRKKLADSLAFGPGRYDGGKDAQQASKENRRI
jgi:hypothetical protein